MKSSNTFFWILDNILILQFAFFPKRDAQVTPMHIYIYIFIYYLWMLLHASMRGISPISCGGVKCVRTVWRNRLVDGDPGSGSITDPLARTGWFYSSTRVLRRCRVSYNLSEKYSVCVKRKNDFKSDFSTVIFRFSVFLLTANWSIWHWLNANR